MDAGRMAVAVGTLYFGSVGWQPGLAERCQNREADRPQVVATVLRARALKSDAEARTALHGLEESVRAAAVSLPQDVEAQYQLALLLGALADRESGRKRITVANEMNTQALRVLEMAPSHAGASFLVGRLHAAIKRLDRVTRFLARHVLGAGGLGDKSWPEIQAYFETAERVDPCEPEHHLELAHSYREQKAQARADIELQHVLELTAGKDGRWNTIRTTTENLAASWKPTR